MTRFVYIVFFQDIDEIFFGRYCQEKNIVLYLVQVLNNCQEIRENRSTFSLAMKKILRNITIFLGKEAESYGFYQKNMGRN